MPKDRSRVIGPEPKVGAVRMEIPFYEGAKLTAVQAANPLTHCQLKTCLDLQRGMGRDSVVFELLE